MRCKLLFLLFLILIISVNAKTIDPENRIIDEFEDGDSSKTVDDGDEFYINIPKDVTINNATMEVDGENVNNIRIEIDNDDIFSNSNLNGKEIIDFTNKIDTDCNIICRLNVEITSDNDFVIRNLKINYTYTETPIFIKYMKDEIKWTSGSKNDVFDLDDYFDGQVEEYKFKKEDLDGITIDIDSSNKVSFSAESGWEGTGHVTFIADDDVDTADSNKIKIIVGSGETKEYQFSPSNSTVILKKGESQSFGVSGSGTFSVDWYLDDKLDKSGSLTYVFNAVNIGVYNIEARIGSTKFVWFVSVLEPQIINPPPVVEEEPEAVCGNGIKEEGENCENCPADVSCIGKAKCINGKCVIQERNLSWIWWLVGFGFLILFVVLGVILFKKGKLPDFKNLLKRKPKEIEKKEEVKEEGKDLSVLRNYLLGNIKKGYKKEDLIKAALKQGWKQEEIDDVLNEETKKVEFPNELEPLKNYMRDGINKGYKKEDLIKAAMKIGWKKEQIDEVLKRI